ncbi:cytochrome c-type biogenesis CcmF C-terminal domain-containing protein [Citricoccus sp. GCM10030269]|uniref:cytochrome c-type biogenesis CcmF C-terminal domain-containing protein n=1 Tax=Citricoccus sp. GCM10030269 TaxID=3273388 RepID=UPI003609E4E8
MSMLGTVLLSCVLAASLAGTLAWGGAARASTGRQRALERIGRSGATAALAGTVLAVAMVVTALAIHDTTLNYVAKVGGDQMPVYYRITALWSALEGSLLLWLLILTAVTVLALRGHSAASPQARAVVGAVLCAAVACFAVVALMASPFTVPDAEIAARPSPLLQDHVAMGIHPPLLYGGFLGLAVPYALSISGLLTGGLDAAWADRVRRWTLMSWILLTIGIVLGAWWSYAVLGWGGYWAWDPVENASFLPWLTATALLHTVAPRARVGRWRVWATGLAGAGFIVVLLATFITRSGVVESIHAFTTSTLGPALLVILLTALACWAVCMRIGHARPGPAPTPEPPGISRAALLRLNRVLLVLVMLVVIVGSLLPSVLEAVTGERLSVGPPWYHRTLAPMAVVLLVAMALGPWIPLQGLDWSTLARRVRIPAVVGALVLGGVALALADIWLAVASGIAAFALTSLILVSLGRGQGTGQGRGQRRDRLAIGSWISHTGMAVAAVAVLGGGLGSVSEDSVPVGGTVTTGTTTATVLGLDGSDEGRRTVATARVALGEGERFLAVAEPQLRWYEAERTMLAGPEILTGPLRDVYLTLLDVDEENGVATLRLAVTPLVGWIWASAGLIVLGAVVAGWPRGARRTPGSIVRSSESETVPAEGVR